MNKQSLNSPTDAALNQCNCFQNSQNLESLNNRKFSQQGRISEIPIVKTGTGGAVTTTGTQGDGPGLTQTIVSGYTSDTITTYPDGYSITDTSGPYTTLGRCNAGIGHTFPYGGGVVQIGPSM